MNDRARLRARLDRAIELKAFEVECAQVLASDYLDGSNWAWLLSILEGTLGTALAVMQGRKSSEWSSRASELQQELAVLRLERRLLDH